MNTTINDLPNEVLEFIFALIPPYNDYYNCKFVCKRWLGIVENVAERKITNLNKSIAERNLSWTSSVDYPPTIAARFSHSSVMHKNTNSIFVFGGASSTVTTFNDLWRYDLSKRKYIRPLAMGSYPSPKACSSMVCRNDNLILFGGWRRAPTHPPYQPCALFDELHMFDIVRNVWTTHNLPGPPAMAGHSATIQNNSMVVFGGLHKNNESHISSNEVWVLELTTLVWYSPKINSQRPSPRYGHFQFAIDDNNCLILGGCGGPNNMFSDAWLLTMADRQNDWKWTPVIIKNKEWGATHMWCNPACKVGSKLIVLGPPQTQSGDLQILKPTNASVPTNQVQQQNQQPKHSQGRNTNNTNRCNGEPRQLTFRNYPASTFAPPTPKRLFRRNIFFQDSDMSMPRRFNELPIMHGQMGMAAFNVSCDMNVSSRERQAERARRMDERMNSMRRVLPPASAVIIPPVDETPPKREKKNCIAIYVCDISEVISDTPTIEWLEYKNNGVTNTSPNKVILSSIVNSGKGELIMFGGLQKESLNISTEDIKVSNTVHFLSAPTSII